MKAKKRLNLSIPLWWPSGPGWRRLARWLAYPLLAPEAIRARQNALAFLAERDRPRARLREALRPVRDLERLFAKVARPTATPRRAARAAPRPAAWPRAIIVRDSLQLEAAT